MALSKKQKTFCDEYLIDLNGTQAAIRAGYSPKTANEQASRLLANVNIRTYIDKAIAERSKRTGINADVVVRELARVAFLNPRKLIDLKHGTVLPDASDDDLAAIQYVKTKTYKSEQGEIIETEIRFNDKNRALELLGKHLGLFKEKIDIDANAVINIIDDINEC